MAPKRDLTAYMFFSQEQHQVIPEENPGLSFAQIRNLIYKRWMALDEEQRARYEAMGAAERERYEAVKRAYEAEYEEKSLSKNQASHA